MEKDYTVSNSIIYLKEELEKYKEEAERIGASLYELYKGKYGVVADIVIKHVPYTPTSNEQMDLSLYTLMQDGKFHSPSFYFTVMIGKDDSAVDVNIIFSSCSYKFTMRWKENEN